jgi:hypothetical protein
VTTAQGSTGYVGQGHLDNKGAITFSTPVAIASTGTIHNYPTGTMSITGGFTILDGTICNNGTMSGLDSPPGACEPGTLDKPAPVLTGITPDSVQAGTPGGLEMVLSGSNFGPTSQIWLSLPGFGAVPLPTTYVEAAGLLTAQWSVEGWVEGWTDPVTLLVWVSNVDGGRSESLPFIVTPPYVVNSLDSCWALNQVDGVTVAAASEAAGGVGGMCQLTGTWPKGATLVLEGPWMLDTPAVTPVSKLILANEGAIYVTGGTPSPTGPVSYFGSGHLDNYGYINFGGQVVTAPSGATHNHAGASIYYAMGVVDGGGALCNDGTMLFKGYPTPVAPCNFSAPPVLRAVDRATAVAGATSPVQITLSGTGFNEASQVWWRGLGPSGLYQYPFAATYNAELQTLTFSVDPVFLTTAGTAEISVQTPDAGTTPPWPFLITETGAATGGQAAGSGTDPTVALDGLDVSGVGEGSVVVTDFQSVPVPADTDMNLERPFDVFVSPHNKLSTLEIRVQVPAAVAAASADAIAVVRTPTIRWWKPPTATTAGTWQVASTQAVIETPASASAASTAGTRYTISLLLNTRTSSPLISQLSGTYFAVDVPVPSDATPPEWTVSQPPNLYEGNATGGYAGTVIEPTATDDSGETPTITCTPGYPAVFRLGASTFTCLARDASGNESDPASFTVTVVDTTPPVITCPADVIAKVGQAVNLGTPGVSDIVDTSPTVTNNAPAAYPPGATTVTWTAQDASSNSAQCPQKVTLTYPWAGFSQPVDNVPVLNTAKAGQTIPLKWRLLDFNGTPVTDLSRVAVTVVSLSCQVGTSIDQIEEYASGASGLQNLGNGYYQWNWKTPASYANSCNTLKLNLGDGVLQTANFQFKK